MSKETSHRGEELNDLGWSAPDVARYIELWEYRQRWGAMNLEREDRLFLRKAEKALPAVLSGRASAKKSIQDKTYYRWLRFHCDEMLSAESEMGLAEGMRGAWPVMLEAELRILEHYEPVLGLPDTLKAKALSPVRETLASQVAATGTTKVYDFQAPLNSLKEQEPSNRWKHLRDVDASDRTYPLLNAESVEEFRHEAHTVIHNMIRSNFPSLSDTDKPELSRD